MKNLSLLLLLFLLPFSLHAQRGKRPVVKTNASAASAQGAKLFKTMLPSTAKVMFIDSVVVEKKDFLSRVPLNSESGSIKVSNPDKDFRNQLAVYQNGFGDRRIYSDGDSVKTRLYTQTMLGNNWSKGAVISDFDQSQYTLQNYPFLAADGVTLYFSAEGAESMGGRDIFMSSFDSDNASWYKPQNMGLPFNSLANDYLLAIDDLDTLGWLVTDRRQPAGKVCIYTFVPTETRQNFDDDDLDDNELLPFANITRIKSTWKFGNYKAAIARRNNMLKRLADKAQNANSIHFVINDNTVITSPSQFRSNESKQLLKQITELQQMQAQTAKQLDSARESYHKGNKNVGNTILKLEQQQQQQYKDIHNLEKKIRQIENNVQARR